MPSPESDDHEESPNGDDEAWPTLTERQLLQRVESRSIETRHAVDLLGRDVIRMTADMGSLRSDLARMNDTVQRVERKISGVRRSADDSGEHLRQELDDMRKLLDQKEKAELATKLAEAQKQVEEARLTEERETRESHKRRKDLAWKILEWVAIAILTACSTHFLWH